MDKAPYLVPEVIAYHKLNKHLKFSSCFTFISLCYWLLGLQWLMASIRVIFSVSSNWNHFLPHPTLYIKNTGKTLQFSLLWHLTEHVPIYTLRTSHYIVLFIEVWCLSVPSCDIFTVSRYLKLLLLLLILVWSNTFHAWTIDFGNNTEDVISFLWSW